MPTLQLCSEEEIGHHPCRVMHPHLASLSLHLLIIAGLLLHCVLATPALPLVTTRKSTSLETLILHIPISDPSSFAQNPAATMLPPIHMSRLALEEWNGGDFLFPHLPPPLD